MIEKDDSTFTEDFLDEPLVRHSSAYAMACGSGKKVYKTFVHAVLKGVGLHMIVNDAMFHNRESRNVVPKPYLMFDRAPGISLSVWIHHSRRAT